MTGSPSPLARSAVLQLALICACWGVGEAMVRVAGLHLPGSLPGMVLLLGLLGSGAVRVAALRKGTRLLLADMLLFFVPAVPAIVDHPEFLSWLGVKLAIILVAGTAIVLVVTAGAVLLTGRLVRDAG